MNREIIAAGALFDGERLRTTPHRIEIRNGVFAAIEPGPAPDADVRCSLLTPPLVESHSHLFLDGDEFDAAKRKEYLAADFAAMLATGVKNLERSRNCGIRVIRDAGDIYGVNHRLRQIAADRGMTVVSAGMAVRKTGRYGSFMAREIGDASEIDSTVAAIASEHSDTLKIILSGIIDFANGKVKGEPQFTPEELRILVAAARRYGLKTFVHCSGEEALTLAVAAGVDSVEHGFFMTPAILREMAERQIAWVPTFIPVEFQYRHPEYGRWNAAVLEKLRAILDNHACCLCLAEEYGVPVMAGSDGGSFGVPHGHGLREELRLMHQAGMSLETVLDSAVNAPRRHFNLPPVFIRLGAPANYVIDPLDAFV